MSIALPASFENGQVFVEGTAVQGVEILSEGQAPSTGILIIDGQKTYYVTKTTPDVKTTIEKLINVLTQVNNALNKTVSALTTIDGKPAGTLSPAPAAAADISDITSAATQIDSLKTEFETLKDGLK